MAAALKELLGDVLLVKEGDKQVEKPIEEVLKDKTAVGLYFSGHWCGPCRGFTPKLADAYNSALKDKGLEIVFVSSDRDEAAFVDYFKNDHPWVALPYSNRDKKNALSKKYKVQGVPSLVMVGPDGATITTDGRSKIMSDPNGDKYPWIPPTPAETAQRVKDILGPDFVEKAKGKYIGLYFSGHWCPPCRRFTPQLVKWYNEGLKDKMECILISCDRDEDAYNEYCKEFPFAKLPWAKRREERELNEIFKVEGVPNLVVLNPDCTMLTLDGRGKVSSDPKGEQLPDGWLPQPFNNVNDDPSDLNEETCVIAIGANKKAAEAVKAVAMEHYERAKQDIAGMKYRFFGGPDGDIMPQIRKLTKLVDGKDYLLILDIPDNGGFYITEPKETKEGVEAYLADFEAKKLERKQLSGA